MRHVCVVQRQLNKVSMQLHFQFASAHFQQEIYYIYHYHYHYHYLYHYHYHYHYVGLLDLLG